MKNFNNWKFVFGALIVGLFLGWLLFGTSSEETTRGEHVHEAGSEYTCSMHPQIRQPEPGQCPLCGMDLVPVAEMEGSSIDPTALQMTEAAMKLASIQTTIVARQQSVSEIKLSGKVAVDERRVFNQSAHFPGRIEKLYIKFEGERVRKGQPIASVYSPALITAQKELLEAHTYKESNEVLWKAAKNKIKLWKLPDAFIEKVIENGEVQTEIEIFAENSGYVSELNVSEGDHLMEGTTLYQVADLTSLWVLFDAYETDLGQIKITDQVHFDVPSAPGRHFHGEVTYIDPTISPSTRTVSIRAEVDNTNGVLKPDMFVDGLIVASSGLGEEILIPRSSVLWTGSRSIVYVKDPSSPEPTFAMREIQLGSQSGDFYAVAGGLEAGEEIVTNGVFSVDAAAQLQGKPSMMNTSGGETSSGHQPSEGSSSTGQTAEQTADVRTEIPVEFKEQLKQVYVAYLKVKDALIKTDATRASNEIKEMAQALSDVDMTLVKGQDHMNWMEYLKKMEGSANEIAETKDVEGQRAAFSSLTSGLVSSIKYFGLGGEKVYYQYCPMAFNNKGDFWLSNSEEVLNPYFGDKMLRCGSVVEVIEFE